LVDLNRRRRFGLGARGVKLAVVLAVSAIASAERLIVFAAIRIAANIRRRILPLAPTLTNIMGHRAQSLLPSPIFVNKKSAVSEKTAR